MTRNLIACEKIPRKTGQEFCDFVTSAIQSTGLLLECAFMPLLGIVKMCVFTSDYQSDNVPKHGLRLLLHTAQTHMKIACPCGGIHLEGLRTLLT